YFLRAERTMRLARLGIAVPVAAAGPEQAEPERDTGEPRTEIGVVARVADLDGVQPLPLEPLEERARAPFLEMRDRNDSSDAVHDLCHLPEGRQDLLHERRAAAPDVAIERVADVDGATATDDRARHVRPAHRTALRLLQHVLELEPNAEAL